MKLNEMSILITGASGGIGAAIASHLGQLGAKILIHYHSNLSQARELEQRIIELGGQAAIVKANLAISDEVETLYTQCLSHFEQVDAIVHCATPPLQSNDVLTMNPSDIETYMGIYVYSLLRLCQMALPTMIDRRFGRVLALSSSLVYKPAPKRLAYITAKTAMHGFIRSLAVEYSPFGIRANLIAASLTPTSLVAEMGERALQRAAGDNLVKRLASPEDIAFAVAYLLDETGDFLTGNVLSLTGGEILF